MNESGSSECMAHIVSILMIFSDKYSDCLSGSAENMRSGIWTELCTVAPLLRGADTSNL